MYNHIYNYLCQVKIILLHTSPVPEFFVLDSALQFEDDGLSQEPIFSEGPTAGTNAFYCCVYVS